MPEANAAPPSGDVVLPRADPATITVSANVDIPSSLTMWVQPWGGGESSIDEAIAELTPTKSVGATARSVVFTFAAEQTAALTRRRRLVLRDTDTGATWFSGKVSSAIDSDPVTPFRMSLGTVSLSFNVSVAGGASTGSGGGAVDSVNGRTGIVVLDAADVGALPDDTVIPDITGLQATSEKNQPNGYAGLDGDGTIPDNRIPSSIARDTEIGTQITAHDGSGTAHSTQFAGKVSTSAIDTDNTLAADSDTRVPSQKAVKAHVATKATLVNTDGNSGRTIYVGAIDPDVAYTPVTGDVWIEVV